MLSRGAWQSSAVIARHEWVATYATVASSSQTGRKEPQVERAIRIKSQQRRRSLKPEQSRESWRPASDHTETTQVQNFRQDRPRYERPSRSFARYDGQAEKTTTLDRGRYHRSPRVDTFQNERQGSVRDLRYRIAQELTTILKDRNKDSEEAFAGAVEKFDFISGFTKREVRIYNIMFRIALRAGKRQWVLKTLVDMKKNGVAPTALTYRSLFEGFSRTPNVLNLEENKKMISQITEFFNELEATWRSAISKYGNKRDPAENFKASWSDTNLDEYHDDDERDQIKHDTSTAKSYASSKISMEEELLNRPSFFHVACERYLVFLFSIKAYDEATALVARSQELSRPKGASKWAKDRPASRLPFLLSSRYLFELLKVQSESPSGLEDSILKAYHTVVNSFLHRGLSLLQDEGRQMVASDQQNLNSEADRLLDVAMSTLVKYDIPDKTKVITKSLQDIYNHDRLASLPPITMEMTLRVALENITNDAPLLLNIFESALDYHDGEAQIGHHRGFNYININVRDVMTCWTKAILATLLELKDLPKALILLERTNPTSKKAKESSSDSTSRFKTSYISTHVFSRLMRYCNDKSDWTSALQVWRHIEKMGKTEKLVHDQSWQFFLMSFLNLASRLESNQKDNQVNGRANKDTIRYSRKALDLLDEEIGLNNELLWTRTESILKTKSNNTIAPLLSEEATASESVDEDVSLCLDYLNSIKQVCRAALDTGEQGAEFVDKSRMEKWKEMRTKAARLRNLGEGNSTFDSDQAEWLRSGDKRKKSLALTDDDMRELLGS